VMTAIRLARGATSRDKIVKFEGCYHGHADSLLVKAGSGALTHGTPSSPGIPSDFTKHTLIAEFNNLHSVQKLFDTDGDQIAAIIIEPIAGNMNMLLPEPGFLEGLRALCDQYKSILIFDEVMTGFRVGYQGAQSLTKVKPDLTTLGKIIGGGMPVGAIGGRTDLMDLLSPIGSVYQAGTLSGNPVAMTAGLVTLQQLNKQTYEQLKLNTKKLATGLQALANQFNIPFLIHDAAGMFGFFFTTAEKISAYSHIIKCNMQHFHTFFNGMLNAGVYLAPSAYEAGFVSIVHTDEIISKTLDIAEHLFQKMR